MFNYYQSVILRAYNMHLFNSVVLAHSMTAILIITSDKGGGKCVCPRSFVC